MPLAFPYFFSLRHSTRFKKVFEFKAFIPYLGNLLLVYAWVLTPHASIKRHCWAPLGFSPKDIQVFLKIGFDFFLHLWVLN